MAATVSPAGVYQQSNMEPGAGVLLFLLILLMTAYACFQQWLRQERRRMIHRERLAALEKGVDLPPVEREVQRAGWNVQRLLLLAGLVWLSLGIGTYLVLASLVGQTFQFQWGGDRFGNPVWVPVQVRAGMQWVGVALAGIGLSHLAVYALGKSRES
jgi:hypothetical protein